ncbi:ATP-binding protein [Streptomyces kebangsaanensis]|uniref:ATP-binding protein n=1 Tax=Streptomyces kebangsaanensis TaxID=864058 RepID=UPI00093F1C3D|nr:ATP-binding protein [Streptomyces kebangsaanensis]
MNHAIGPLGADIDSEYRAEFAVGEHSARHLRCILRLYLTGSGLDGVADAAELALTELVANVVRHVPGRRCRICFLLQPGGVRVEVADDCPELPVRASGDPLANGGRGLVLVAAVTDRWGVTVRPDGRGKTVWFECMVGGVSTAPPAPGL